MATLRETVNLADHLTELTQQLHGELTDGDVDFDKMIRIADEISEQADQLASAFERVNQALTEPLEHAENGERRLRLRAGIELCLGLPLGVELEVAREQPPPQQLPAAEGG